MLPLKLIQLNKHKQMIRNCEHIDLSTECRIVPCWRERVAFQSVIGMKKIFMPFQFEIVWNEEGGGGLKQSQNKSIIGEQNAFLNGH